LSCPLLTLLFAGLLLSRPRGQKKGSAGLADEGSDALAERLGAALDRAIADPQSRTADLGGELGTKAFGARVAGLMEAAGQARQSC